MSFEFAFAVPTRVEFGPASLDTLGPAVAEVGSHALVLAGRSSARDSGLLERCEDRLADAGVRTSRYEGIPSNPTYSSVLEACQLARANAVDAIVAVGGGSVMDTGRAVALALARPADFWECRVRGTVSVPGIPANLTAVFTVPTVNGTGSEISPAALVRRADEKEVFFSPHLFPRAAFIDPSLSCSVGARVTAEVGVDALVQGIEAYVSSAHQPLSDMFALEAVRLAARWLPAAVRDGADITARSYVALAALLSLFAINQAGVGGIHALSNPLSGRYDLHHGRALSLVAAPVIEHNWSAAPERYATVDRILGGTATDGAVPTTAALRDWLAGMDLGGRLADHGIPGDLIDAMAHEAQNPDMSTNPRDLPVPMVRKIYESVL